jgi:3'(2'), 5'-bisphosphate nucleotidase
VTSPLLDTIVEAALAAGDEIERIYAQGCEAREKSDGSPVTIADQHAERIILDRLALALPDIPVLAEEEAEAACSSASTRSTARRASFSAPASSPSTSR